MFTRLAEKFASDIELLIMQGDRLVISMRYSENKLEVGKKILEAYGSESEQYIKNLPNFKCCYQTWYTQSKTIVRHVIPDRLPDFINQYDRQNRKTMSVHNYTIDDYLNGLRAWEFVKTSLGFARMEQQVAILRSAQHQLKCSIHDIRQRIAADLFDRGICVARDLLRRKCLRAAAAVAGVVLEECLLQTCQNYSLKIPKTQPTAKAMNDLLIAAEAIEISQYQANQLLADLHNICMNETSGEPTNEQALEFINGVARASKTISYGGAK